MESNARGRKALLTGIGVLAALVLVAVASRGSTDTGGGGASRPADMLVDLLFTLYLLVLVAGAILFVYLLALNRANGGGAGAGTKRWQSWLGLAVLLGAMLLFARDLGGRRIRPPEPEGPGAGGGDPGLTTSVSGDGHQATFAWIPVLVTLALVGIALAGSWWARRSRRRARGETPERILADAVAAAVDESLDDLRAEPDPRRAVIAAYARLERVLAAHGLPRRPSEAPLEYLERMLARLAVRPPAARRLTELFERARFSQHAVGLEMKEQAISALEDVRDDLAAARALAEQERTAALRALRERTAR